jgi:hypothetical protein
MQRHYLRLILLLTLFYCYMFRSYDHHQVENILLARITQLTTDPFFYNIVDIIVIVFYNTQDTMRGLSRRETFWSKGYVLNRLHQKSVLMYLNIYFVSKKWICVRIEFSSR